MNHHESHQQRMNAVLLRQAQRYRRDDRDGAGLTAPTLVSGAVTKNITQGMAAVWPRTRADGLTHEPVDRAVVLCDREQVSDADQRNEQVTWKARQDVGGRHVDEQASDDEGHDQRKRAHVDRHGVRP